MIKKSRKILTLLLASLLIMSSMGALTVSAATTFYINDNTTVVSTESNSQSYTKTFTAETGWYRLMVKSGGAATNQTKTGSVTNYYGITATIDDASWTAGGKVNTGETYVYPGKFYLEYGKEFTITLTYDLSMGTDTKETIKQLSFTKIDDSITVSSTEETKIPVTNYLNRLFRWNNDDGESTSWTGASSLSDEPNWKYKAVLTKGNYGIYRVNVPQRTVYDIYALECTRYASDKFNLYVDGAQINIDEEANSVPVPGSAAGTYKLKYTKLGTAYMSEGKHDIKLELSAGTTWLGGLKLVPATPKTVNQSGSTEFSFYNDRLNGGCTAMHKDSTPNSLLTSSAGSGETFTLSASNGTVKNNVGTALSYAFKVEEKGIYDIYFIAGGRNNAIDVYLDGKQTAHGSQLDNNAKGSGSVTAAYNDYICSLYLTEGIHNVKFVLNTTQNYFFTWSIETNTDKIQLNSTEGTIFDANEAIVKDTQSGAKITEYKNQAATGVYAGTRSLYQFVNGAELYYTVESPSAQSYSLSTIVSYQNRTQKFRVTNANTGEVLCEESVNTPAGGTYETSEQMLGTINLPQGRTTLKIEAVSGSTLFLYAFKLTPPYIENKIIADINTEINQGEGYETVEVPIMFEGKIDNLASLQIYVAYDEGVTFTGYTAGNVVSITNPSAKDNKVPLIWVDTTGDGVEANAGTLATLEFSVPKTTVKDYNFVVTVQEIAGTDEVNFADTIIIENGKVTVVSRDPIITFTNGSEAVEDVVANTMVLNVDLNGNNNKNLVIFAIYSENDEYAVMEYSQTATIEDGIATATINNITLDNSKNYYAKAFVWDTTSYYGFVETLDN